ncbi:MAG: tRNA epoxyqueuosine(34) reductase QueG [Candidatus Marinimicrobia bacterium]|nr:tRNA epoxyqueuosine(34) reductase QueG [Candidatus Neomarinimicrobiota bacterium]MDP6936817.1 tRNA epoxyqueuosine(34) reductase QueG [Candidatus Neomarinimicrobiota bacterium]
MTSSQLSSILKETASELGFSKVGIAPAVSAPLTKERLYLWLDKNYHSGMKWMAKRKEERGDIKQYYPQVKSVISLGMNYFTGNPEDGEDACKISNYAWGDDYHEVVKNRMYDLYSTLQGIEPEIRGIVAVDTSPITEKDWAQKAGLGWLGKHTNLITREFGSWLFLGELLLNVELEYDKPFTEDLCGSCTACLDACPTNAFPQPYVLDSEKCISYLTIEHRGDLPEEFESELHNWVYGCDICQEVCPWNISFQKLSTIEAFQPREDLQSRKLEQWKNFTKDDFRSLFSKSAVKRTKFEGLSRNIEAVRKSIEVSK